MNNSSYEGVAISSEQDPYDTSRLSRLMTQKRSYSSWVDCFCQKYFFAALIGSDEYIYNYYVLPRVWCL